MVNIKCVFCLFIHLDFVSLILYLVFLYHSHVNVNKKKISYAMNATYGNESSGYDFGFKCIRIILLVHSFVLILCQLQNKIKKKNILLSSFHFSCLMIMATWCHDNKSQHKHSEMDQFYFFLFYIKCMFNVNLFIH